ncbi:MAG: Crp/Fnr family transcriptional regulator, partial [Kiloniellales bacterium]|nr:Crp/Fnr family transcriptional regulator [Kiloniellales bacterium]
PGETLGYKSFLRKAPHDNSAEVLMPSIICFVKSTTVQDLLSRNPDLGLEFLNHSLRDLRETENRYMESVTWKARTRLLHLLLVLNERFGKETKEGTHKIELPISRQDLAGLIGTAPETMSRTIQRLQTDGIARFDGRTVVISNIEDLYQDLRVPA